MRNITVKVALFPWVIFNEDHYCVKQLVPSTGMIRKNSHLRIGRYHQHLHELLDLDLSPLDYMLKEFPEVREREEMRKIIGRYGLTGRQQVLLLFLLKLILKALIC